MKKIFLSLMVAVALSGCSEDPFQDVERDNAVDFSRQACNCADGFEGSRCEWRQIDKFLGKYPSARLVQGEKVERVDGHLVKESSYGNAYLEIVSSIYEAPLQAEVDGWNFNIRKQKNLARNTESGNLETVELEGCGWIDQSKGILVYKLWNPDRRIELDLPEG